MLQDSEIGSSEHRTFAYIHAAASYRTEKDGGAGMLHLPSHSDSSTCDRGKGRLTWARMVSFLVPERVVRLPHALQSAHSTQQNNRYYVVHVSTSGYNSYHLSTFVLGRYK